MTRARGLINGMFPAAVVVGVGVGLFSTLGASAVLAQCTADCVPIYDGPTTHRKYRINYGAGVNPTEQQRTDVKEFIRLAGENWNYELARRNNQGSANYDQASNDIEIIVSQDLSGDRASYDYATKKMVISKDYLTQFDWAYKISAVMHEFGHALGYRGANAGCNSVMAPTTHDNYRNYFTDCDQGAFNREFGTPQEEDYCANGGCTPGYAPIGTPGCSEASIDECGCCLTYSPIVLDLAANGIPFSSAEDGAMFTINDMRRRFRLGWPLEADDAWLWLDRNGNGFVDHGGELFGNATRLSTGRPAPDGFAALVELDSNADGIIDRSDDSFSALGVWRDVNRDGYSQAAEVAPLASTDVVSIELTPRESRRTDRHGNVFRYRAVVHLTGVDRRTWAWDVYPTIALPSGEALACRLPMTRIEVEPLKTRIGPE